jgi:FKBP-type peptidyl-prolyl cis-trans isomerase FkpA
MTPMKKSEFASVLIASGVVLFLSAGPATATDNVPALLQYAKDYSANNKSSGNTKNSLVLPSAKSRIAELELLQRQLASRTQTLEKQLADKDVELAALRAGQQKSGEESNNQVKALTKQLQEKDGQLLAMAKQAAPAVLDSSAARQAYAAGVLYGRDLLEAKNANQSVGLKLDDRALLAGVMDALAGKSRMDEKALLSAQNDVNQAAKKGLQAAVAVREGKDADWVSKFTRQKNVVKGAEGYWYRVDYAGEGERLRAEDTIDLVVTESLTDGTVVSDMDAAGSTLTEKVSALPPAFSGALIALKNHGSLTLVVPPSLAYGDKGYPPKVPPGATMVYKLRVANVIGIVAEKGKK